jgi:2-iminobutanoate/2-iminopropanoate deaminase
VPGTEEFIEGGIEAQTRQVLENLKTVLEASSSKLENVVKTTMLLNKDMSSFAAVNRIYTE